VHLRRAVLRAGAREVGLALIALGVIVLLFVAYELWGTGLVESHDQTNLKKGFQAAISAGADDPTIGTAPQLPGAPPRGAIDHMVIPRIHLDVYVVQGVSEADLREGPGHYPQTPFPGQNGNSAIAGHRTTYGAPFFDLNELKAGDDIWITDLANRTFLYKVTGHEVVLPSDVSVLDNTPFPQLTLTTCNPRFSATTRLIVFARLSGKPAPPLASTASLAGPAQNVLGAGDSGAWPSAIGYGALVVALLLAARLVSRRLQRWRRASAIAGCLGLALVPLWFCFENVVLLLPQSI
jgi:sortase A